MGQEKILVSVIIATYGRPEFLQRCLESVASQSHKNLEIIVVDDNDERTDEREATKKVMSPWTLDQRVRYLLHSRNMGGSVARNTGLAVATGDYVTFLDDDDTYELNKVSAQLKFMLDNSLDVSLCHMRQCKNGHFVESRQGQAYGRNLAEFLDRGVAYTPMIMAKSAILSSVGGFYDTPRFQDHVLMIRLLMLKPKVGILPAKLFTHYVHGGQQISFSPASKAGYAIKHAFERKALTMVDAKTRKSVRCRHHLELARIEASEGKTIRALTSAVEATKYVNSKWSLMFCVRTMYRIIFMPRRVL